MLSCLKSKPPDLVLTCLNRFETATNVDKTGTVQVGSPRIYAISHTDNATHYRVSENDENMPYAHVLHENSHITRANIFCCISKLVLGCIIPVVSQFSQSSTWHLLKGKIMFCYWRWLSQKVVVSIYFALILKFKNQTSEERMKFMGWNYTF